MKYRKIGNSDISVSEIGFGAWSIAMNWWGKAIDEQEAKRMIKKAYDVGINFFETSEYSGCRSWLRDNIDTIRKFHVWIEGSDISERLPSVSKRHSKKRRYAQ